MRKNKINSRTIALSVVLVLSSISLFSTNEPIGIISLPDSASGFVSTERTENMTNSNLSVKQPLYVEHYKITRNNSQQVQEEAVTNQTRTTNESFSGNGTIKGLSVVIGSGEATFTLRNNNTVLIEGNAELTTKDVDNNTDRASCTFHAIGRYEADGRFNSVGAAFFEENATGKLSFLSNVVGIYKDVTDKEGNGTFTMWEWK